MASNPRFSGLLFGAAYYFEYQASDTLDRDLDLMKDAAFNVIRVGESVWSTWEPHPGEFDLEWLQPVLDAAHERGIGVILGTPTYAVPLWLTRMHPEIAAEQSTGVRIGWGERQEMDQSAPAYRFYAERIVRKVIARYGDHPAIIGYQVDNEPGMRLPHNEATFQAFIEWLRGRYGTVERLNREWGLVYWSHRLSDWADLWRPDNNAIPQYALEWRRFQATLCTELIGWQADVVREYAKPGQFITTCISYSRAQVADDQLVRSLDVVAGNPYYRLQDALDASTKIVSTDSWWSTGPWALFEWSDRAYASAQAQFLVTETDAGSIGMPWQNQPPYPGQLKQSAYALLSRGARMIQYWQWNSMLFGPETYWGGILPHNQQPGRIYDEIARLGADLAAIGSALDEYAPDVEATLVYSQDSKWLFQTQSPLALADGTPDHDSYDRIFDAFYRGLHQAGLQVGVRHAADVAGIPVERLVQEHPVIVVPALYVADDALLEHLRRYADAGGHLVVGIRSGYADELGRVRPVVAPGILRNAVGVHYTDFSNLDAPLPVRGEAGFEVEPGAAATLWIDSLEVDDAEVLVRFPVTEIGASAVVTSRASGAGRATYIGTVPNVELARSIGRWLKPSSIASAWSAPSDVSVATGRSGRRRFAFLSNWSPTPHQAVAPEAVIELVTGRHYAVGDVIALEPRAALVFEATSDSPESDTPHTEGNHD
jgi:beta-galactosidase